MLLSSTTATAVRPSIFAAVLAKARQPFKISKTKFDSRALSVVLSFQQEHPSSDTNNKRDFSTYPYSVSSAISTSAVNSRNPTTTTTTSSMQRRNLKTKAKKRSTAKGPAHKNNLFHYRDDDHHHHHHHQHSEPNPDCIFCKILSHELPSGTVYEDDVCQVILDIHPVTQGHMLILPKLHVRNIMAPGMHQEMSMHMMRIAHLITAALTNNNSNDSQQQEQQQDSDKDHITGTNLLMNNGKAAWQTVPHAHMHVIPRRNGDSFGFVWGIVKHVLSLMGMARAKKPDELEALAAQMNQVLIHEIQSKQQQQQQPPRRL